MPPTECLTCAYADEHGSWPPDHRGTHCRDCHRSWTSKREAHCARCCGHFTSDTLAERHWCDGRSREPERHRIGCDGRHGRPWEPQHIEPATVPGLVLVNGTWCDEDSMRGSQTPGFVPATATAGPDQGEAA